MTPEPVASCRRQSSAGPSLGPTPSLAVDRVYDLRRMRRVVGRDDLTGEILFGPKDPHRQLV
jgi:hypothetical protein